MIFRVALLTRRNNEHNIVPVVALCERNLGMTMIELVAALSIFTLIALTLFAILNTSTHLWSEPAAKQNEAAEAEGFLDLLEADLEQAVADGGNITNPVFMAWTLPQTPNAETVQPFLRFVRSALPYGPAASASKYRLSLDCVTYSVSTGCIFRYVTSLPLSEDGGTLGQLVRNVPENPAGRTDTASSLLVRRGSITGLGFDFPAPVETPFTTNALPLDVTIAVSAFGEEDWSVYLTLFKVNTEDGIRKRDSLGVSRSRIIHLPAYAGGALP